MWSEKIFNNKEHWNRIRTFVENVFKGHGLFSRKNKVKSGDQAVLEMKSLN